MEKNKILILLIVVIIVVVGLVVLFKVRPNTLPGGNNVTQDPQPVAPDPRDEMAKRLQVTNETPAQVKAGLPVGLPLETGAKITENRSVSDPLTGDIQLNYSYVSKNKIDDNFAAFQKYFSDNTWQIVANNDQLAKNTQAGSFKALTANKDGNTLVVLLRYDNPGTKDNFVSLYYSYKK